MGYQKFIQVITGTMLFVSACYSAVVYQDDFSNAAASAKKWSVSNPPYMTVAFSGNACSLTSTNQNSFGFLYHVMDSKLETFTASCKITKQSGSDAAGLTVNFDKTTFNGFNVLLEDNEILFFPPGVTKSEVALSSYIDPKVNTLTVSKKGSIINVFVNGHFAAKFENTSTAGSDVACTMAANSTVIYNDFSIADTFTDGALPTSFTDDFEDGKITGWNQNISKGNLTESSGKLHIQTENDTGAYVFATADVDLSAFIGKASFSHLAGSVNSYYGLALEGEDPDNTAIFVITGNQYFSASIPNMQPLTPAVSQSIYGKAEAVNGVLQFFTDTLELVKKAGSDYYTFMANGHTLAQVTGINFKVVRAGVYCSDSLSITVDDFSFGPDPTSIKKPYVSHDRSMNAIAYKNGYPVIFNPLGRTIVKRQIQNNRVSSGLYILKSPLNTSEKISVINR